MKKNTDVRSAVLLQLKNVDNVPDEKGLHQGRSQEGFAYMHI